MSPTCDPLSQALLAAQGDRLFDVDQRRSAFTCNNKDRLRTRSQPLQFAIERSFQALSNAGQQQGLDLFVADGGESFTCYDRCVSATCRSMRFA